MYYYKGVSLVILVALARSRFSLSKINNIYWHKCFYHHMHTLCTSYITCVCLKREYRMILNLLCQTGCNIVCLYLNLLVCRKYCIPFVHLAKVWQPVPLAQDLEGEHLQGGLEELDHLLHRLCNHLTLLQVPHGPYK